MRNYGRAAKKKRNTNTSRSILKSKLRYQDILLELPIRVHNSHLLTSFLHQVPQALPAKTALDFPTSLAELSRDPDVSSNPFAPNLDSLDLSIDPFLEKSCDLMLDAIENQVRASGNDPEALNAAATNAVRALVTGDEAGADEARGQAAQALANARGIPLEQAQQQVAQMEEQYHQTVDQAQRVATETADTAASVVSLGALLAFVALVLGAVAGWLGGRSGVVHPVYADRMIPTRRSMA